jgi:hypothetical protein
MCTTLCIFGCVEDKNDYLLLVVATVLELGCFCEHLSAVSENI